MGKLDTITIGNNIKYYMSTYFIVILVPIQLSSTFAGVLLSWRHPATLGLSADLRDRQGARAPTPPRRAELRRLGADVERSHQVTAQLLYFYIMRLGRGHGHFGEEAGRLLLCS